MRIAAPSCIYPAHIPENCQKIIQLHSGTAVHSHACVNEIALMFFQGEPCLEYGEAELPPELAELPMQWSVHLPLDLPIYAAPTVENIKRSAEIIATLREKVAFLRPHTYVLHPPQKPEVLSGVLNFLQDMHFPVKDILLENVEGILLENFSDIANRYGTGFCIDTGHMLAFQQKNSLTSAVLSRVRMVHIYSTPLDISGHKHHALDIMDEKTRDLLYCILENSPKLETITLEVFSPEALEQSGNTLRLWLKDKGVSC
ncbi:MAG: cobamide remodeling phosphodiesterase CbiR [Desulfovibrio sp.]